MVTGLTYINRDVNSDLNGFIGKFETSLRINTRSNITLYGHAQYTDSSRNFLLSRAYQIGIRGFDTQISADILYEKYIFAGYSWQFQTNTLNFEISRSNQDYEESLDTLDRTTKRAAISFDRNITRLTSFNISGYWSNNYYEQIHINDEDITYYINIDYRLSNSLIFRTGLGHRARKSNEESRDYEANSVYFSINYANRR